MVLTAVGQLTLTHGQSIMRRYDTSGQNRAEMGFGIELGPDSSYIIFAGTSYADSLFYSAVVTSLRVDAGGAPLDTSRVVYPLHTTFPGWANVAFRRINGGFGIGGSNTAQDGTKRPTLYLTDSNGDFMGFTEYGVTGQSWIGRQGKQTPDGGYVICGETSSSGTSIDGFLLKIDSFGNEEWVQTYGAATKPEYLISVDLAPSGGYYLAGTRALAGSSYDQWLLRVDSSGDIEWDNVYGTLFSDEANAHVESLSDGGAVFATSWALDNNGMNGLGMARVDSMGDVIWSKQYDGNAGAASLFAVKEVLPGTDLIATGGSYLPGYYHGVLLRTDAGGDSLWMRYYHYYDSLYTQGQGDFRDVLPTPDKGFVAVGTAYGSSNPNDPPAYGQDTWMIKVDSMGCLVPGCHLITGLQSQVTNLRDALTAAPNPASDVARLAWELPDALAGSAQLSVVSAAGQLVNTLPVVLSAKSLTLDITAYPAGLYHLHLVVDGQWVSGCKMIVE